MKGMELLRSKEWSGKFVDCALRFALAAVLSGAQVFGGYAPLALGLTAAAGPGVRGLSALVGASAGAFLFLPFTHALRTFAAAVLIFTANNAFFDLKLYRRRFFLPLMAAGMMFSVEFVYVLRDGVGEAANCLVCLLLTALGAMSGRALLAPEEKEHPFAALFILLGVLMAFSSYETANGFAPGRIASMLVVLLAAFERSGAVSVPAAVCIGLAMDLTAGDGGFTRAAAYAFAAILVSVTCRGNRVGSALWFVFSVLCFALPMSAQIGLVLVYETLAATLLFLLIPAGIEGLPAGIAAWGTPVHLANLLFLGLLILTGAMTPTEVWAGSMGHFAVITMIVFSILNYALKETGLIDRAACWFVSRRIARERPLVFLGLFFLSNLVIGMFVDNLSLAVIYVGLASALAEKIGVKKGDPFYACMFIGILWCNVVISIASPIAHAPVIILTGMIEAQLGITVSYAQWLSVGIPFAVVMFLAMMIAVVIWRPDASAFLAFDPAALKPERLSKKGKITAAVFLLAVAAILLPEIGKSVLPTQFAFWSQPFWPCARCA